MTPPPLQTEIEARGQVRQARILSFSIPGGLALLFAAISSGVGLAPGLDAPYYAFFWQVGAGLCGVVAVVAAVVAVDGELSQVIDARRRRVGSVQGSRGGGSRSQVYAREWVRAQRVRRALIEGRMPPAITPKSLTTQPGETFFVDTRAAYSRYAATVDSPSTGRPAFVNAGLMVAAPYRRQHTWLEAQCAQLWRRPVPVRVACSDHRIAIHTGKRWLSFPYAAMTAVYPEVSEATLVCEFATSPPLLVRGAAIPIVALITLHQTAGADGIRMHPALGALLEEQNTPADA